MTATLESAELVDVVDLQPIPGEYLFCTRENRPKTPHEAFGVTVDAWFPYHAQRIAVQAKWGGKCECCGARLRYAHIVQDADGAYHCFGHTCVNVKTLGAESARKLEYSQRIEEKKDKGFCATFNVPSQLWDMPREQRPAFARLWKGAPAKRGSRPVWKLSVWGDSREECLANCMELQRLVGVKLA